MRRPQSGPTPDFAGRTAVVTGATSGMGRGIAEALGRAGASVVAVGRDEARLADVERAIAEAGGTCATLRQDIAKPGTAATIVARAHERFGPIDLLVPAAGIFLPRPLEESDDAMLDDQWSVNVRAPFALVRAAAPDLRTQRGAVVFLSSMAGHIGFPGSAAYCATKGAVEGLTRALAVELAPEGVRVNAVAPGNVRTPMNAALFTDPAYEQEMLASTPAGRIGEIDDVVPATLFLLSDAARYITGVSLLVDGGWTAA